MFSVIELSALKRNEKSGLLMEFNGVGTQIRTISDLVTEAKLTEGVYRPEEIAVVICSLLRSPIVDIPLVSFSMSFSSESSPTTS
jgi:hypothetical protein